MWRAQPAALIGAKCTLHSGVTFIGEFYTPPNIPYYRDLSVSPLAGRQSYAYFGAGKNRLRDLPGWKEWDVSGSVVANLERPQPCRRGRCEPLVWQALHILRAP